MNLSERESYYLNHFRHQKSSGLSVKAYCKKHGISDCSYYHWRKRLSFKSNQIDKNIKSTSNSSSPKFLPVKLTPFQSVSNYQVEFSNGTKLTINSPLKTSDLQFLFTALKE